jgi:tRNA (guanosine-2'-O-)-methyltransferase
VRQLHGTAVKRLNRTWRRKLSARLALVLDGVASPFNVGAIVRTAATLGAEDLYLSGRTAAPSLPSAQRLAMGTDRYLEVVALDDATAAIAHARASGYFVVALEIADNATPIFDFPLARDTCVVVCNEDHGLTTAQLDSCDAAVYLPQFGKVGSLNVATAAAMACYEVRRQQLAAVVPTETTETPSE